MKRIISFIIAIVMLTSTLSSCAVKHFSFDSEESQTVNQNIQETSGKLTLGQWLVMVNDAFGMQSYIQTEPYYKNVKQGDPYFEAVQIATEWNVLDRYESINIDEELKWERALVTLVNAGGFTSDDAKKDEKINYAIDNFANFIKKDMMGQSIDHQDAVVLLSNAQEKWANKKFDTNVENVTFNEEVVNLTNSVNLNYEIEGNDVVLPTDLASNINVGDIYVIQSKDNPLEYTYHKVDSITENDGKTYISNSDDEIKLEDVFDELELQGTVTPTVNNTIIYDGNGNVINTPVIENQAFNGGTSQIEPLGYSQIAAWSNKHKFKYDDYEITLSYNLDGALDMKIQVESEKKSKDDKKSDIKTNITFEISNLDITQEFDFGILKGLKHAALKVDYETKTSFGVSYTPDIIDKYAAPPYSNGNGKFLTNLKRSLKNLNDKGEHAQTIASKKTIKICSLNVYNAGVAKICLDVNLKVGFDGSITVTVTQGGTTGIEYKNGNLRFIKQIYKNSEIDLKAKLEGTLNFGPALYIVGLEKKLVGLEVQVGVGAECSVKLHLADVEMHLIEELSFDDTPPEDCKVYNDLTIEASTEAIKVVAEAQGGAYKGETGINVDLHVDSCFDISAYWIFNIGVADHCYLVDFTGDSVKLSCSILSSKNAKFLNYHVDNLNWGDGVLLWGSAANDDVCKLEYVPFDDVEENENENETTENQANVSFGEFIMLSDFRTDLSVGGKYCISIAQLPTGYSLSDLTYKSSNNGIAKVNSQGVVEGVKGGSTIVTVKTRDGKYQAVMSVSVSERDDIKFEGLGM